MAGGSATQFGGVPYVGALFDSRDGQPTTHFATAFVVSSEHGNMLMSAAHVLSGRDASSIIFAPGYASGQAPHNLWHVQKAYTDSAWQAHQSIDDDFCFLKVGADVQGRVGSLNLLTGAHPQACNVIGYPDGLTSPVQATVQVAWYAPGHQLTFTCNGYPDGTSGSPWIINRNSAYGLIGGYEQGGATPAVSYSPYFGANVRNLYNTASAAFL
jgi:V8-like Glu-specific endopeptidase